MPTRSEFNRSGNSIDFIENFNLFALTPRPVNSSVRPRPGMAITPA